MISYMSKEHRLTQNNYKHYSQSHKLSASNAMRHGALNTPFNKTSLNIELNVTEDCGRRNNFLRKTIRKLIDDQEIHHAPHLPQHRKHRRRVNNL